MRGLTYKASDQALINVQFLNPGRHQVERRQLPSRRGHHLRGRRGSLAVRQAELPPDQNPLNDDDDSDVIDDDDDVDYLVSLEQIISFLPFFDCYKKSLSARLVTDRN